MTDLLGLVQTLQMAIKAQLMYTTNHPRSRANLEALTDLIEDWLDETPTLHLASSGTKIFINSEPFDGKSLHLTNTAKMLADRQISGLIFSRGITIEEIQELLDLLILKPAKIEELGGAAQIIAEKDLPHLKLSQIQYREVKEGSGGAEDDDDGAPAMRPKTIPVQSDATPALPTPPSADEVKKLAEEWRQQFKNLQDHAIELPHDPKSDKKGEQDELAIDLSFLGGSLACLDMGENFPTPAQIEGLRQPLMELPPKTLLAVMNSMDTLPRSPAGLQMAFQALAPEAFAKAAATLMADGAGDGFGFGPLKDQLHGILQQSSAVQGLLAALEAELRKRGMGLENLQELVARLDWDNLAIDEKIRMVMEMGHLWKLSHEQRLAFLKQLLDEGRTDAFTAILEMIIKGLSSDDPGRREVAARTLVGVAHWLDKPGLPVEAEGAFIQGLCAHFGWEPLPHIHRASAEALGAAVTCVITRGEPGRALGILNDLEELCVLLDSQFEWRTAALAWLWTRLSVPEALARVLDLLHTANPETLLTELIPYLEKVGPAAAQKLVEVLGDEQDRKRRARLVEVIRGLGTLALPAVHESLASPKWYLVRNTLNLVADMGDVEALPAAVSCLSHSDVRVRRTAVRTVWKLGGAGAAQPLMKAFAGADQETMLEIMFGFSQIRSDEPLPLLGQFATDRRMPEKLRCRAAETLGLIGDSDAIPYLEDLIKRKGRIFTSAEPTEIRVSAARGLVSLGSLEAITALRKLVAREPRNQDRPLLQHVLEEGTP